MNSLSHWLTKGKESHFNTHGKYGKNSQKARNREFDNLIKRICKNSTTNDII